MMKKFYCYFLFALLAFGSFSCIHDEPKSGKSHDDGDVTKIEIQMLNETPQEDVPSPIMLISIDDWNIIEYSSNGLEQEAMTTLYFMNKTEEISMVLSGYRNTAMLFSYNPMTQEKSDTVYMMSQKEGLTCMSTCIMNWSDMTYRTIATTTFEKEDAQMFKAPQRSSDDFAEIRAGFYKTFENMSKDISKKISKISKLKSTDAVIEIWTKSLIPIMKYELYYGCPDKQKEIRDSYALNIGEEYGEKFILELWPKDKMGLYNTLKTIFKAGGALYKIYDENHDFTDEEIDEVAYKTSWLSNSTYEAQGRYEEDYIKFVVKAYVSSIEKTSAKIWADYYSTDGQQSYISEMGFDIYDPSGQKRTYRVSDFESSLTLTDLSPGTYYYGMAYVKSMNQRYESAFSFQTTFEFGLHPESLSFTQDGGDKGVALNVPSDGLKSWSIKSKPQWCEITKGASSFFVKVGKTDKDRKGEIVVVATLHSGVSYEAKLPVEQVCSGWNDTSWDFSGSVSASGNMAAAGFTNLSQVQNFGLIIRSVQNNDFTFTGDLAGTEHDSRIYTDSEGRLIWEQTQSFSEQGTSVNFNTRITFTRTGDMTSTGTLSGSITIKAPYSNDVSMSMTGNFTGTRVVDD